MGNSIQVAINKLGKLKPYEPKDEQTPYYIVLHNKELIINVLSIIYGIGNPSDDLRISETEQTALLAALRNLHLDNFLEDNKGFANINFVNPNTIFGNEAFPYKVLSSILESEKTENDTHCNGLSDALEFMRKKLWNDDEYYETWKEKFTDGAFTREITTKLHQILQKLKKYISDERQLFEEVFWLLDRSGFKADLLGISDIKKPIIDRLEECGFELEGYEIKFDNGNLKVTNTMSGETINTSATDGDLNFPKKIFGDCLADGEVGFSERFVNRIGELQKKVCNGKSYFQTWIEESQKIRNNENRADAADFEKNVSMVREAQGVGKPPNLSVDSPSMIIQ